MSLKSPMNVQTSSVAETKSETTPEHSDGQDSSAGKDDDGEKDSAAPRRRSNRRET